MRELWECKACGGTACQLEGEGAVPPSCPWSSPGAPALRAKFVVSKDCNASTRGTITSPLSCWNVSKFLKDLAWNLSLDLDMTDRGNSRNYDVRYSVTGDKDAVDKFKYEVSVYVHDCHSVEMKYQ